MYYERKQRREREKAEGGQEGRRDRGREGEETFIAVLRGLSLPKALQANACVRLASLSQDRLKNDINHHVLN